MIWDGIPKIESGPWARSLMVAGPGAVEGWRYGRIVIWMTLVVFPAAFVAVTV